MDFADTIRDLAERADQWKELLTNEEETKTYLILPFIETLGYDINPKEVKAEYDADIGKDKGEKVDYAIIVDGEPAMLIECKSVTEKLGENGQAYNNAWKQLYWYFNVDSRVKFAILTNGISYRFFTDLEDKNKLDDKPFLEVDLLDLNDAMISELKKFHKSNFNKKHILSSASQLKYESEIKHIISREWDEPTDEFVKFIVKRFYDGNLTQNRVDWFKPIVRTTLNRYLKEQINDRLNAAVAEQDEEDIEDSETRGDQSQEIVTTEKEMHGFMIVRTLLKDTVDLERIGHQDYKGFFSVLLDDSKHRIICRLKFNQSQKYLNIPNNEDREADYPLENIEDIANYKKELEQSVKRLLDN